MKRKKGRGSRKGSSFERTVCKQLSLWWTGGKDDSVFWRTSNSGGRATLRGKKGLSTRSHHGDLCAVDDCGKPFTDYFTVEAKRGYPGASSMELLDQSRGIPVYRRWIEKAITTHKAAGSQTWLLIVKRNGREPLVLCDFRDLETNFSWEPPTAIVTILIGNEWKQVFCVPLGTWLSIMCPNDIREKMRRTLP